MIITLSMILCFISMLAKEGKCLNLLEVTAHSTPVKSKVEPGHKVKYEAYTPLEGTVKPIRRYWLLSENPQDIGGPIQPRVYEDEKDANIKKKISSLVDQTVHDAQRKMKVTEELKDQYREESPYRAGFILSLVKKCKDVMDELFNVAVKHKNDWVAIEQMKVFELIVHTNVDTTNLLRQLVDVHVKHLNATRSKRRVILLK